MTKKITVIFTFFLLIGTIMLLSTSIQQLNLNEQGKRFRFPEIERSETEYIFGDDDDALSISVGPLGGELWGRVVGALFTVLLVASLLTKEGRRRLFNGILLVLPIIVTVYAITIAWPAIEALIADFQSLLGANKNAPILQLVSTIPPYIIVLTSLLLAILVVFAGWGVGVFLQRRRVFTAVSAEATTALAKIESGSDLRHVIIEAYRAMGEAVSASQGISRAKNTTPREYEKRLVSAGLPSAAVERLTRLFEQVRYGGQLVGDEGRIEAQSCLQAIVDACEAGR